MMGRPEDWLISTAAIPLLAAIGVSIAFHYKNRRWGLALVRLGMAGGTACALTLAILLNGREESERSVHVTLGKWFSFSSPHATSITFGLEADFMKACLFGLIGVMALLALLRANSVRPPFSSDIILTSSLLYFAGAFFAFAPNLAQSLLGWGAISLLATILIQLSNQQVDSNGIPVGSGPVRSSTFGQIERADGWGRQILRVITSTVHAVEWTFNQMGKWLNNSFPNWLSEQAEVVVDGPVNIQLLAAILGTSTILLTWLFMPYG